MNRLIQNMLLVAGLLQLASGTAWAQIAPYTGPRLGPPPGAKPGGPIGGGGGGKAPFGIVVNAPPNADPHDLNGLYFPVNPMIGSKIGNYNIDAPGLVSCRPELQVGAGPYPQQIFQTPKQITFIEEYNHMVRPVYMRDQFPDNIVPSPEGTSIGHWEGDVLVVQTIGLTAPALLDRVLMKSIDHLDERIRKLQGGQFVEDDATVVGTGDDGKPKTVQFNQSVQWIGTEHVYESICEEGEGLFFSNSGEKSQ